MENNFNIFDLFDDPDQPVPAAAAIQELISKDDIAAYHLGYLKPLRPSYVHLGLYKGTLPTVFSAKKSQVDRYEFRCCQKTVYVIPLPLPDVWLKDPAQHSKAVALERALLEEMGFHIIPGTEDHGTGWELIGEAGTEQWKIENCLCQDCLWLKAECRCHVQVAITECGEEKL